MDRTKRRYTERQGQYLAFIAHYSRTHGRAPSELDIGEFFGVAPPTAHQMILRLEERGLIERTPGVARSISVRVPIETEDGDSETGNEIVYEIAPNFLLERWSPESVKRPGNSPPPPPGLEPSAVAGIVAEVAMTIEELLVAEARHLGSAHTIQELARLCVRLGVERALSRGDLPCELRGLALSEIDTLRRRRQETDSSSPPVDPEVPSLF